MRPARAAVLVLALIAASLAATAAPRPKPPNLLYILADDMGVGDVSCLNPRAAWRTPRIDRLASEGRVFADAHSAAAVCTPSRYALLAGRYPWRGSLKSGVLDGYDRALLEPGRMTVASLLRDHGYDTAMVGKWHLGLDWVHDGPKATDVDFERPFAGGPTSHGFDRFLGIAASLDMPPYTWLTNDHAASVPTQVITAGAAPRMWRAGAIAADFRHEDVHGRLVSEARHFLESRAASTNGRPFFLYVALASPHTPIVPTGGFEGRTKTNPYGDFVAQLDASVGELLDALDRGGLARDTLVVFTADNGCSPAADLPALAKLGHDPQAGRRGHKADLFEGGHRVPFVARWPGVVPAGTRCDALVGQLDLLATCAEWLGEKLPPDAGEDSVGMLGLLRGDARATPRRRALVHQSIDGSLAIREGRWKLLECAHSGGWSDPKPGSPEAAGLPPVQLYDLDADPAERDNVAAKHPGEVRRLQRALRAIREGGEAFGRR